MANYNDIDLQVVLDTAHDAGNAIMKIYRNAFVIDYKDDASPITQADSLSNNIICTSLQKHYPNIPILSEENNHVPYNERKQWKSYWCIDPIDGTKEFIKKNDEFTVNIALIDHGIPVIGVVYAPAIGDIYYAQHSMGAYKNGTPLPFTINTSPKEKLYM
jgi:3'(2'), 5'-bisphosphate nucleotidase